MAGLKFTDEHEWVRIEGDNVGVVGISDYAQKKLGDMVYVELPTIGRKIVKGGEIVVVESVKAASEVFAPVSGEVIEVNAALNGNPAAVNEDPLGKGWLFRLRLSDSGELAGLKDLAAYEEYVKGLG